MDFDKHILGNAIRNHRLSLGYTSEYLAEQVDITVTHMKHIESGHRLPSVEVLYRLVQVLRLSLDDLWLQKNIHDSENQSEVLLLLDHCNEAQLQIVSDLVKSLLKNSK